MYSTKEISELYNIPQLQERQYWFVRTDSGLFFKDYYTNGYIAIGWDYLTPDVMKRDDETVKKMIASREKKAIELEMNIDEFNNLSHEDQKDAKSSLTSAKRTVTAIYNKVSNFINTLKVGDIVVVPGKDSKVIAIGIITSEVYEDGDYPKRFEATHLDADYEPCPYYKRRHVQWQKISEKRELDIYLQSALRPQQTITSMEDAALFINRAIYDIYTDGDTLHSIFRTNQEGSLTLRQLSDFTDAMMMQLEMVNSISEEIIRPEDVEIKLNVHSPGVIEVISIGIGAFIAITTFINSIIMNKHGGEVSFSVNPAEGVKFSYKTPGKEGNEIKKQELDIEDRKLSLEERKLVIYEKVLGNPEYMEKLKSLNSLNLDVPDFDAPELKQPEENNKN